MQDWTLAGFSDLSSYAFQLKGDLSPQFNFCNIAKSYIEEKKVNVFTYLYHF